MSTEEERICEMPGKSSICSGKSKQNINRGIEGFKRTVLSKRWINWILVIMFSLNMKRQLRVYWSHSSNNLSFNFYFTHNLLQTIASSNHFKIVNTNKVFFVFVLLYFYFSIFFSFLLFFL